MRRLPIEFMHNAPYVGKQINALIAQHQPQVVALNASALEVVRNAGLAERLSHDRMLFHPGP
jgi:hypothetical protein